MSNDRSHYFETLFRADRVTEAFTVFEIQPVEYADGKRVAHISSSVNEEYLECAVDETLRHGYRGKSNGFRAAYRRSSQTFEDALDLYERAVSYFDETRAYLNPDLALDRHAKAPYTNGAYLNQAISYFAGCSFSHFLNHRRMNHLFGLLSDGADDGASITDLIDDSGFGSYTSFYRYVKRVYGTTPKKLESAYLEGSLVND